MSDNVFWRAQQTPNNVFREANSSTEYSLKDLSTMARSAVKKFGKYKRHTVRVAPYGTCLWVYYIPKNTDNPNSEQLYTVSL